MNKTYIQGSLIEVIILNVSNPPSDCIFLLDFLSFDIKKLLMLIYFHQWIILLFHFLNPHPPSGWVSALIIRLSTHTQFSLNSATEEMAKAKHKPKKACCCSRGLKLAFFVCLVYAVLCHSFYSDTH